MVRTNPRVRGKPDSPEAVPESFLQRADEVIE
jgi:hypothetical protein